MKTIIISENEANQRLDKFLIKYFNQTGPGFVYKMLRKKNFKLNSLKASGNEILKAKDELSLYLSDETHDKMHSSKKYQGKKNTGDRETYSLDIVYEDEHVLIVNKPVGLLSQSDTSKEVSLNDIILDYLANKAFDHTNYRAFKPGICNRLDRNTGGLIIAAKTYIAANTLSYLIRKRLIKRFYCTVVKGSLEGEAYLEGSIFKDKVNNYVHYIQTPLKKDEVKVALNYRSLKYNEAYSLLEVELITGKSHQIRVQLSSIGHPILGDNKYGDFSENKKLKLKSQLLTAYKLEFPKLDALCLKRLSGEKISIPIPETFSKFIG